MILITSFRAVAHFTSIVGVETRTRAPFKDDWWKMNYARLWKLVSSLLRASDSTRTKLSFTGGFPSLEISLLKPIVVGTAFFMAGRAIGSHAPPHPPNVIDQWGLGCLLYREDIMREISLFSKYKSKVNAASHQKLSEAVFTAISQIYFVLRPYLIIAINLWQLLGRNLLQSNSCGRA